VVSRALIVGDETDAHVVAVLNEIDRAGGEPPLLVDAPRLASLPYSLANGELSVGSETVRTDQGGRGWLRRYAPTMWGAGSVAGTLESVRKRAYLTLVGSISRAGDRNWLTSLGAMLTAEDRLHQLEAVSRCGFRTPRTVVAGDGEHVRQILGDRFIVKPLANGFYHADDGPRAVFTTSLTVDDLDRTDFSDAPFVAQEQIEIVEHLRVVTVNGEAWAAALSAEGRPMDWRQQDEAHTAWQPTAAPDVCAAALKVAAEMDVGYTSQDWVRDNSSVPVFLDLNPGGQWLFLPREVGGAATEAIASYLLGRDG